MRAILSTCPAIGAALALVAALAVNAPPAAGQTAEELQRDLKAMQTQLEQLQERMKKQEELIDKLSKDEKVVAPASSPAPAAATSALDRAIEDLGASSQGERSDLWSRQVGGGKLRLIDVSFDVLTAAGWSTASDSQLSDLQGGAHDPNQRGFTLQQAELSLMGAVDPYFTGEGHIVFTPSSVELEEAFLTTTSLPYNLQFQGGYFFSDFGVINPLHPHAWDWIDQPVINTRMFGGDGLRATGGRLSWLLPLAWFSEVDFGVQNANQGETTVSFIGEDAIGGRPTVSRSVDNLSDVLYLARWENFVEFSDEMGAKIGASGLHGPNNTGSDGETWIYGADLKVRWRPANHFRGWPFVLWQTEAMKRDYTAAASVPPPDDPPTTALSRAVLRDYGFYSQLLYGFHPGWAAGVRAEYVTGSGQSVGGRANDPYRDDRFRLSPLLMWQPSEFSRFRLQYNYDDVRDAPVNDAHTVWIGAEILYGAHPAHRY